MSTAMFIPWPVLPRAAVIGPRMLVRLKSLQVRSNAECDVTGERCIPGL